MSKRNNPPSPRRRRRKRRALVGLWIARVLTVLFSIVGLLPLVAGFVLRTKYASDHAAVIGHATLRKELGIDASFVPSVQPWPLAVRLDQIEILSTDGGEPALKADSVTVKPRVFSLIQGKVDAGEIEINRPRVRLVVHDGKLVNLSPTLPETSDSPTPKRPPLSSLSINDAQVQVDLDDMSLFGKDIDIDVGASVGPQFDVTLRTGRIAINDTREQSFTGVRAPPSGVAVHEDTVCAIDARVSIDPEALLVRRLRITGSADVDPAFNTRPACGLQDDDMRKVELEMRRLSVRYDSQSITSANGHVRARAPLRILNRYVPFLQMQGWASVQADGSWYRGQKLPQVRASIEGKDIALGVYRVASELSLQAQIEGNVISVPTATVGFSDGTVEITSAEVQPMQPGMPLTVQRMDLDKLKFTSMMRDLGVTDHTVVNMDFDHGSFTSVQGTLDPLRIDSDLVVHVKDFEVFDLGFDNPARKHVLGVNQATVRSSFVVLPDAIEFQSARVDFGKTHLNVFTSIGFSELLRVIVSDGSELDLEDINPLLDIPWKGMATVKADIHGGFINPQIEGDLAIEGFEFADVSFGDIAQARVHFQPMVMQLSNIAGKKGKSNYRVPSMLLDFTGPAPVKVDGDIEADAFDVRDFFSVFHFDTDPRFEGIEGTAKVNAHLYYEQGGALDKCNGGWMFVQARGSLRNVELFDETFESGGFELDYEWYDPAAQERGVRANIRSVVLNKGDGTIVGQGTIRPGGELRARAVASNIALAKINSLGELGALLDARASATADVRGTLDRMEADVDTRISQLRVGSTSLPASNLHVHLSPTGPAAKPIGRTRCGNIITGPFDPVEYAKDLPTGVFEVNGNLFGQQLQVNKLRVTSQKNKTVSGQLVANNLDFGKLLQAIPSIAASDESAEGTISGVLDVTSLRPSHLNRAELSLLLTSLQVKSPTMKLALRPGAQRVTLRNDTLVMPQVAVDFTMPSGIAGAFTAGGKVNKVTSDPQIDLSAALAPTDLASLATFVPRVQRARGTVQASLNVLGSVNNPRYHGHATITSGALGITGFPVPLEDIDVKIRIKEREIALERATARMGLGRVSATGTLPIDGFKLGVASASITARDVNLPIVDGVKLAVDADLTGSWNAGATRHADSIVRVGGDVRVQNFEYTRAFGLEADIGSLEKKVSKTVVSVYDPEQDFIDFDVRVHVAKPVRVRNNMADLKLSLDSPVLMLAGSNQRVGLRGALRVQPGGRVRLRANEFEVREGVIRFDDLTQIAPHLDVTAVTDYRRYSGASTMDTSGDPGVSRTGGQWRIQLHAHGDTENLRLDLTSEPALSQEDIVLLLTFGVTRAELDQMQASSLGESAALEALSALSGTDTIVRESIPVIDDFRFGSAYSSRSGRTEPTVTVGKRITERVRANATTGLSDTGEVRSNVEWELTGKTSILGSWDNVNNVSSSLLGNIGADVRFRITFE